uniref:Uncharacterized protein LOC104248990 n=1 Tax=Nicotiana sylvestris TaxID=4096 RepID=A0A1U7YWV2_NICSY|nr:PREDICTED: uncharacterized protein LOC104248990 [Nicotiana sylvestris]
MSRFLHADQQEKQIEWTPECQQALRDLKRYLSSPPLLSKPKEGETLLVYLTVSEIVVSVVLVREDEVLKWYWRDIIGPELNKTPKPLCKNAISADATHRWYINQQTITFSSVSMAIHEVGNEYRQTTTAGPREGAKISNFLEHLKIKRITSSPYHLSAKARRNRQNKVIIQNLKKRLEATKGKWPEELPGVLWAYQTTAKSSIGETPFSLMYGAEALIPMEVGEPTLRYFQASEETNNEAMSVSLELLDERRDLAHIIMAVQK